jgi:hypothetical protein
MHRPTPMFSTLFLLVLVMQGCQSSRTTTSPKQGVIVTPGATSRPAAAVTALAATAETYIESKEPLMITMQYVDSAETRVAYLLFTPYPVLDVNGASNSFSFSLSYVDNVPMFDLASGAVYVSEDLNPQTAALNVPQAPLVSWSRPRVKGSRVVAVGESTKYIVHVDSTVDRVCRVSGQVRVYEDSPNGYSTNYVQLTSNETYAEGLDESNVAGIYDRGSVPPESSTGSRRRIRDMYDYMVALAATYGIP